MNEDFKFLDPGRLIDDELELILTDTTPAHPEKNYVSAYKFEMRDAQSGKKMGRIDLRIWENESIFYGWNIGYGVDESHRWAGLAARSVEMLLSFAKKNGMKKLSITCDPENIASRKTCERVWGELLEIVELPKENEQYQNGDRKKCRYIFDMSS